MHFISMYVKVKHTMKYKETLRTLPLNFGISKASLLTSQKMKTTLRYSEYTWDMYIQKWKKYTRTQNPSIYFLNRLYPLVWWGLLEPINVFVGWKPGIHPVSMSRHTHTYREKGCVARLCSFLPWWATFDYVRQEKKMMHQVGIWNLGASVHSSCLF